MNSVMLSEKGKCMVIKNRYKFCFHKYLKRGIERWKCSNHNCKAYFKIGKNKEKVFENECHNHEQDSVRDLKRQKLNNELKQIVVKNMNSKPAKIIHNELSKHMDTLTSDDIKLIKRNMYRTRSSVLSKLKTKG